MKTLAERVQWIVQSGIVTNARQWSIEAGLTPKHVGTFLYRAREKPDADMERGSVEKLARAAGVSFHWLASGEGSPSPIFADADDDKEAAAEERAAAAAGVYDTRWPGRNGGPSLKGRPDDPSHPMHGDINQLWALAEDAKKLRQAIGLCQSVLKGGRADAAPLREACKLLATEAKTLLSRWDVTDLDGEPEKAP